MGSTLTPTMLTFTALGPFQAWTDGNQLDLGGQRQRAVLARLLVAGGHAVPVSTLIDELWPGNPPVQALSTVQGYVSRLRRALEPGRAPRDEATVLVSAAPGYALRALPEQVDSWWFQSLIKTDGPAPEVWAAMESALALWRGPALAEFAELHWAATEAARLEELRLIAVERRADAGLSMGRATAVVADLEAHAAGHPLREEAWRLLALALYRTGRQGDALGALRRARTAWREELGLDLSDALRRLESDMLAQRVQEPPAPPRPGDPGTHGARPLRVLVADDQALVRAGLKVVLSAEAGLEPVGEAANGEEAIAAARTARLIAGFSGRMDPESPPALAGLSDARLDLLKLVARGLTNRQIGQTLSLPEPEVAEAVRSLLDHLGLFGRAQLVVAAYESGLVTPGAVVTK